MTVTGEDVIRQINEAVGKRDPRAASEWMHPNVVWEHNIGAGTPEEGVYRGREDVKKLFERILEPWEYLRVEAQEIHEVSPDQYVVRGELRAKHETSDREVVTPYEQEAEIAEGMLMKGRMTMARVS